MADLREMLEAWERDHPPRGRIVVCREKRPREKLPGGEKSRLALERAYAAIEANIGDKGFLSCRDALLAAHSEVLAVSRRLPCDAWDIVASAWYCHVNDESTDNVHPACVGGEQFVRFGLAMMSKAVDV